MQFCEFKLLLQLLANQLLKLDGIGSKLADALRQLLNGHLVFVVLPAEFLLIKVNLLNVLSLSCCRTERGREERERERGGVGGERGGGRKERERGGGGGGGGRERERERERETTKLLYIHKNCIPKYLAQ